MGEIHFEREKFRELIVLIAERTSDDPDFGDTHLNKALYWTDFLAYRNMGRPATGARYFKLQYGPAAKPLLPVRDELVTEGRLNVVEPGADTWVRKTLPGDRPADKDWFTEEELRLVDEVIASLQGKTAGAVSDQAHQESAGWRMVEMYDDIPYHTALISDESPSEATLAKGRELAERLGW